MVGATGTPVAYFDSANTLERVSFTALEAPSGGTTVVQLNTADDGSGSGISVTIADGANFGTATGSVAIAASSYLYMLVTSDAGGALALSGSYEVSRSSGVTTFLTTLAKVKLDDSISGTDADRDTVLNTLIAAVSARMQSYMGRLIVQTTATDEKIDSIGSHKIQTRHFPIISVSSLTENDTALVEDTDFEREEADSKEGHIVRISGSEPIAWASRLRVVKVTYDHGYASVPDDLVQAATAQVVQDYHETAQSGKGWRGLASKGVDPSSATTYDKDFWARETVPVMQRHRGPVV
jgi:hypothetical protein